MLKKCYFESYLLQVLINFYVLVSVINPIYMLRSKLFYLSQFLENFAVFGANSAEIAESIQA